MYRKIKEIKTTINTQHDLERLKAKLKLMEIDTYNTLQSTNDINNKENRDILWSIYSDKLDHCINLGNYIKRIEEYIENNDIKIIEKYAETNTTKTE